MKLISKVILPLILSECAFASTIYGIESIDRYKHSIKMPVYVQMGSFTTSGAATNYQRQLTQKTHATILIRRESGRYQVRIGPFNDYASLKKLAQKFPQYKSFQAVTPVAKPILTSDVSKPQPMPAVSSTHHVSSVASSSNWYVNAQVGAQKGRSASSTTVNNGSGFASPNNQDIYSANSADTSALLGLGAGYRWELGNQWLTAVSLGAQYEYFAPSEVNGQVTQFSLPQFTNYNYTWKTASNVILAQAKLNLANFHHFSPFVAAGVGAAFNRGHYTELALSGVTARTSPDYAGNTGSQFAYTLGAGLDYEFRPDLIMSAGYQYSDLGTLGSGYGATTWSSEQLNFGRNQANAVLFGMTYLFDTHTNAPYQK